jgi:hypothetical protein
MCHLEELFEFNTKRVFFVTQSQRILTGFQNGCTFPLSLVCICQFRSHRFLNVARSGGIHCTVATTRIVATHFHGQAFRLSRIAFVYQEEEA